MNTYTDAYTGHSVTASSPVDAARELFGADARLSHVHPATDDGHMKWCAHVLIDNKAAGQLVWDRE